MTDGTTISDRAVAANLAAVKARIAAAAALAGRDPDSVALIAVSKMHDAARIRPALETGHRLFGENRVQEARAKWPPLRDIQAGVELHLIGPLQTNKVKDAVALFDVIHSLDREKLARHLAREIDRTGRRLCCFVQVNTGAESQKAGVLPDRADAFIAACREDHGLAVDGLMCIPPVDEPAADHFGRLAEIARRNGLRRLSMGMSADYELAIAHGATHVRIGTAIFGARPSPP